ncbi:hypothetical protein GCM10027261_02480 [Geodermatophilus arenarius]
MGGHGPGDDPHTGVQIAHVEQSPVRQVWQRVVLAAFFLALTVFIVWLDRDSYRDGDEVGI